eukprot:m.25970 g.25970  ORF g.25970 m.25970 type:complete len:52 (-) comp15225_c0_seq1:124-279(-)
MQESTTTTSNGLLCLPPNTRENITCTHSTIFLIISPLYPAQLVYLCCDTHK